MQFSNSLQTAFFPWFISQLNLHVCREVSLEVPTPLPGDPERKEKEEGRTFLCLIIWENPECFKNEDPTHYKYQVKNVISMQMTQTSKTLTHPKKHLPGGKNIVYTNNTRCWTRMACLDIWRLPREIREQAKAEEQNWVHLEVTLHIKLIPSIIQGSDGGWRNNGKRGVL